MSEFCNNYGIPQVAAYTPRRTHIYVYNHPRGFVNAITGATPDDDLEQLAHAIQQFAYSEGVGLRGVLDVLRWARDDAQEFEEQEAMT